jgi:hypothetical protein
MQIFASEYLLSCEIHLNICKYLLQNEYFEANVHQYEKSWSEYSLWIKSLLQHVFVLRQIQINQNVRIRSIFAKFRFEANKKKLIIWCTLCGRCSHYCFSSSLTLCKTCVGSPGPTVLTDVVSFLNPLIYSVHVQGLMAAGLATTAVVLLPGLGMKIDFHGGTLNCEFGSSKTVLIWYTQ